MNIDELKNDPYQAYEYALNLNVRFFAAEPKIAEIGELAYKYSVYVMKKRFIIAEKSIANSIFAIDYALYHNIDKDDVYYSYYKGSKVKFDDKLGYII